MKNIFFALFLAASVWACQSKPAEEHVHDANDEHQEHAGTLGDPRATEVMAIHDSIMPRMEDIMRLKSQLRKEIQQLDSLGQTAANKKKIAQAESLEQGLEQADQHMMGWMHQYSPDTLTHLDDQEAKAYLDVQKNRIVSVKTAMQQAIANAEDFLKK